MAIQNILVVDDSKTELYHLSDILGKRGYRVRTAENGEEALRRLGEEKPGALIRGSGLSELTQRKLLFENACEWLGKKI